MAELTLATLAAQAFTGLVLGMILVLLAIGLSLIFGLMTVVNFAHGSLYMLGAYLGFFLIGYTKSFWLALVVAPLLVGALGFGIERFLVRPLYGRSIDDPLLLTFGLSLVMVETVRLIWGKIGLTLDPPRELAGAVNLGFTYFPLYRLFVIGVTVVVLVALFVFLEKTNVGLIIRAGSSASLASWNEKSPKLDRDPPRRRVPRRLRGLPVPRAVQGARHAGPDLRPLRPRLQPPLRLHGAALLRPRRLLGARRLWHRYRAREAQGRLAVARARGGARPRGGGRRGDRLLLPAPAWHLLRDADARVR